MADLIDLPTFTDARGALTVLEKAVPFAIRRVYFIHKAQGLRGGHRHKSNRQVLIAVAGSVRISVNDGTKKDIFILGNPRQGLLMEAPDWHTMDEFSDDCVLLVLASEPYDVNEYIDEPYS